MTPLPHDKNAEAGVLGAIMLRNETMSEVSEILGNDAFFIPAHRWVYEAMQELASNGQPIDIITLEHTLRRADTLDMVGGIEGLGKLTDRFGTSRGAVALAWRLRKLAAERGERIAIEEIESDVNEIDLAQTDDVKLVRTTPVGTNFKALCPWHGERTPSLNVNPERQGFKCFGCGAWGTIFLLGRTFAILVRRSA